LADTIEDLGPPDEAAAERKRASSANGRRRIVRIGRLDEGAQYFRVAAQTETNPDGRAEALWLTADVLVRRGDLDAGEQVAREGEALDPGLKRMPSVVLSSIEARGGRLERALQMLKHACTIGEGDVMATNRRAVAGIQPQMAVSRTKLGQGELALDLIRQAETELSWGIQLTRKLNASAARVHALRNERDLAMERIATALKDLERMPSEDLVTRELTLYTLSRGSFENHEIGDAETRASACLTLNPEPVYLPGIHYLLAECRRMLDDSNGERDLLEKTASFRFGTQWERLARERLAALGHAAT
jgi:hypothetical protein